MAPKAIIMYTIFTNPRPFKGNFELLQRNAIKSWMNLSAKPEIFLFEDEEKTTSKVAQEYGLKCIDGFKCDEFGTPLLSDVFEKVRQNAKNKIIVQVNADIVLTDSFSKAIEKIAAIMEKRPFFMSGRRWDLDVSEPINFEDSQWQKKIIERAKTKGRLHGLSGMDYWVLPANFPFAIPAFVVGRPGMDSWLVYKSRKAGMPVIDATLIVDIVHQNHNYPQKKKDFFEAEKKMNLKLAGGFLNMMTLREANFLLAEKGLERPEFPRLLFSFFALFLPWRIFLLLKRQWNYLLKKW